LIDAANQNGGVDNSTAVTIRISWSANRNDR
jgi:serine/threonine protein phosphatase PrpC